MVGKMLAMNKVLTSELKELLGVVHYRPAVSVILPFEPMMTLKTKLVVSLESAADRVKRELEQDFPEETVMLIMHKLKNIFRSLNFATCKKSIAVYVSPVFEKVLYLDIPVDEKIIIDESFEIRDLVYSKKQVHKYLVLMLGGKESRIYLGNSDSFVQIVTNRPEDPAPNGKDMGERVANFSDSNALKEIRMDKFLHNVDNVLDIILKAYHLPLFVSGTERILGHFKKLTRHSGAVIEYIHGNYLEKPLEELQQILAPHVADWKKVKQKDLLNRLEEAAGKKKLVSGMKHVWQEAVNHKGRLLLVEKNYMYAAEHTDKDDKIREAIEPYNKFSYIKGAVDDVMEKVLENGGDVEFVDEGLLDEYQKIALLLDY